MQKRLPRLVLPGLFLLLLGFFWFKLPVLGQDLSFPKPQGFVNDFAGIFSAGFTASLEKELSDFEQETKNEIAVVTVENLAETTIEDYAVLLFEDWKIGKKDQDNGLLILVAPNQRQVRIEVGYGLEPVITDGRAGRIIRSQMTPYFKKGDYETGVKAAVDKIKGYLISDSQALEPEEVVETAKDNFSAVFVVFFILVYLSSFWGRSKRFWPGGVTGGILGAIAGLILQGLFWTIFLSLGFGLFGLFLDWLLSKNYKIRKKTGRSTGWWSSFGGFSSGGGGGGGFGGFGGGSSGGGGASGSW